MADIAILVVEEFERRKNWEKAHGSGMEQRMTTIPEMSFRLAASSAVSSLEGKLREEIAFLKAQVPPMLSQASAAAKSPFAAAAFEGLFSA